MANSNPVSQDEIELLLRQAQAAAGVLPQPRIAANQVADQPGGPHSSRTAAACAEVASDDIQYLLAQAQQALASVDRPSEVAVEGVSPFSLPDLSDTGASDERASLELLRDVDLDVRIELGRTQMYLEDALKLRRGSVVSLDKLAGDPVDIFVNGRLIARGEVLVMNDNFCIKVAELIAANDVN